MNPFTPDFTNAKVGDECFSVMNDVVGIDAIIADETFPIYTSDDNYYAKDGIFWISDKHPSLFNSFQQFIDYWQWERDDRGKDA